MPSPVDLARLRELRELAAEALWRHARADLPGVWDQMSDDTQRHWRAAADVILALVAADREGEQPLSCDIRDYWAMEKERNAARAEVERLTALLTELRLADRGTRDSSDFQRHRDVWRRYAKTGETRPTEYLSSPVGDDPTIIDTLRADVARLTRERDGWRDAASPAQRGEATMIRRCARCNGLLATKTIPRRGPVTVHAASGKAVCPLQARDAARRG